MMAGPASSCCSRRSRAAGRHLAFYAFDLLVDRGEDIRKLPNIERKERLAALLEGVSPPILYGDHVIGRGEEMFDAVCKAGRRGHHLQEGERALQRHAHAQLAEDQMHPAPGIRHRRLVGKRQAHRLPLTAARREGEGAS